MKKGLLFLLLLSATFIFAACGQSQNSDKSNADGTATAAEKADQVVQSPENMNKEENDQSLPPESNEKKDTKEMPTSDTSKTGSKDQSTSQDTEEPAVNEGKTSTTSTEEVKNVPKENKRDNQGIVAGAVEPKLELTIEGNTVKGSYLLKNQTEFVQKFKFSTSQRIAVVVKQGDHVVYDNRLAEMYMQVIGEEKLIQGEEKTYQFEVNNLAKGSYTIDVWYTAQEDLFHVVKDFQITDELTENGEAPKLDDSQNKQQGIVAGAVEPKLELSVEDNMLKGIYMLKNQTEFVQKFKFSTSQRIGVVVKQGNQVVYDNRLSQMYMQVIGEEQLIQGEEKNYSFEVKDLAKGTYTVDVWFTAQKDLFHVTNEFTVE